MTLEGEATFTVGEDAVIRASPAPQQATRTGCCTLAISEGKANTGIRRFAGSSEGRSITSWLFAGVPKYLQNHAFVGRCIRACSPLFGWVGVLLVYVSLGATP